jgi:hypothetical protein
MEKYGRAGQATDDNLAHAFCILDNERYKHTLRICDTYSFPRQKCLHERASMLHYTYIACLVLLQCQYLRLVLTSKDKTIDEE